MTTVRQDVAVTVIIPVYNSSATLQRAALSALDQTLRDIEVIIIDDGSTDNSNSVARELAERDSRLTVIGLPKNIGKARAMNHASELARGSWIAVLDSDDQYLPTRLAKLLEAGERHGVELVADNQLHLDDATGASFQTAFSMPGEGRLVGLSDFIAHSNPAASFDFGILKPMIRRDFLVREGLSYHPGAKLAEDFYFMLEFFAKGGRGWLVHEPLYLWTLPFSPSKRQWTNTGSGAWRYDYRDALRTNRDFQQKFAGTSRSELRDLLRQRERAYKVMVHYLDAQRLASNHHTGARARAAAIIVRHPSTWPLLARRVTGRLKRAISRTA